MFVNRNDFLVAYSSNYYKHKSALLCPYVIKKKVVTTYNQFCVLCSCIPTFEPP